MAHTCHATGCRVAVPRRMFMCRHHWFSLPKALRDRIWATYRSGRETDWRISHAYAEAAREGVEPDLRAYDMLDPGGADA